MPLVARACRRTRGQGTFFVAFTRAHLALCVAAIFLRAAADNVRLRRIGTTLAFMPELARTLANALSVQPRCLPDQWRKAFESLFRFFAESCQCGGDTMQLLGETVFLFLEKTNYSGHFVHEGLLVEDCNNEGRNIAREERVYLFDARNSRSFSYCRDRIGWSTSIGIQDSKQDPRGTRGEIASRYLCDLSRYVFTWIVPRS